VHSPEFTFAHYESNVERAVREFALTYPVVIDSDHELWKAYANRCWPTKYLLDKEGYLRFAQFGEGSYGECEQAIQDLLHEIDPALILPKIMEPLREEDQSGAVCYPPSPELYLGHRRGRIGNDGGFREDAIADYAFAGDLQENCFYASGKWASTAEYFEAVEDQPHRLLLRYSAAAVNLVMAAARGSACEVTLVQDGKALSAKRATHEIRFRRVQGQDESYITVEQPRMYSVVDNHEFGEHTLELVCPPGLAVFAFTFTSCLDPVRSALAASVVQP
jgi:hypothetical protein